MPYLRLHVNRSHCLLSLIASCCQYLFRCVHSTATASALSDCAPLLKFRFSPPCDHMNYLHMYIIFLLVFASSLPSLSLCNVVLKSITPVLRDIENVCPKLFYSPWGRSCTLRGQHSWQPQTCTQCKHKPPGYTCVLL